MKKGLVLGVVAVFILIVSMFCALAINGVKICGQNFNCGNNDGVCPTTYGGGSCSPCDPDCSGCGCTNGNTRPITCGIGDCTNTATQLCVGNEWTGTCVPKAPSLEICSGGGDEDCDNFTNCADSDCIGSPSCPPTFSTFYWCDSGSCPSALYTNFSACNTSHPSGCYYSSIACSDNCAQVDCGSCTGACCGGSATHKFSGTRGALGGSYSNTTAKLCVDWFDVRFFCSSNGWYVCDPDEKATTTWSWFSNLKDATNGVAVMPDGKYCCYDSSTAGHWQDKNCSCIIDEKGKCADSIDNDCDALIDGEDGLDCPEGSGNSNVSIFRACADSKDNDVDSTIDLDDGGCCDLCKGGSLIFDTAKNPAIISPGADRDPRRDATCASRKAGKN